MHSNTAKQEYLWAERKHKHQEVGKAMSWKRLNDELMLCSIIFSAIALKEA